MERGSLISHFIFTNGPLRVTSSSLTDPLRRPRTLMSPGDTCEISVSERKTISCRAYPLLKAIGRGDGSRRRGRSCLLYTYLV